MRPFACLLLVVFSFLVLASPGSAYEVRKAEPKVGVELATTLTQVTGIAISPLLGVSGIGAYYYFKADTPEQKARLPWFAHPGVWGCGFLIVGLCFLKDSFGAVVPTGLKKPLDFVELAENKLSALIASGAVIPILVGMAAKIMADSPSAHYAPLSGTGLAMIDLSWALNLLMIPLSLAAFVVVWLVSHAIHVLILLSPWGAVDAVLKLARTAVLALVTATAYIDPVVGALLSLAVIGIAYFASGWAFRLLVFGSVFTWDFLTRRRRRFHPAPDRNWVFLGRRVERVPIQTLGRLARQGAGGWVLLYRPWLVLPERRVVLPTQGLAVGEGLCWPTVEYHSAENREETLLTLPPRYCGHERSFAEIYGIRTVHDVGLRRGWTLLKELFGTKRSIALTPAS